MSSAPWNTVGTVWAKLWDHGPGEWVRDALCAQTDPELFFPPKQQSSAAAKLICLRCDVKTACLAYAMDARPHVDGVWGGTTERQRKKLRTQRRTA